MFAVRHAGSRLLGAAGLTAVWAAIACSSAPPPSREVIGPAVAPEALAGDWMLETRVGDQSHEGKLHFSFTGGVLAGSVYDAEGNSREMKNIAVKGDKISWEAGNQKYEGTAGSLAMKGTVSRAARRQGRQGGGEDEDSGSAGPPPGRGSGGGYGRGGRGGRSGGRGGGGSTAKASWSAYKSVPSPTPTALPSEQPGRNAATASRGQ